MCSQKHLPLNETDALCLSCRRTGNNLDKNASAKYKQLHVVGSCFVL